MGRPGFCSFTKSPNLYAGTWNSEHTHLEDSGGSLWYGGMHSCTYFLHIFRPIGSSNDFAHALRLEGE
jgi:predicted dehydrogenase